MKIEIRRAELNDINQIAIIHVETWQNAYSGILPNKLLDSQTIENRSNKWRLWLDDNSKFYIVGLVDDVVMGFCSFYTDNNGVGEIEMLYVHPDAQGKKLGKNLMDYSLSYFKKASCSKAVLWVLRDNHKAQDFYKHYGWNKTDYFKTKEKNGVILNEVCYKYMIR